MTPYDNGKQGGIIIKLDEDKGLIQFRYRYPCMEYFSNSDDSVLHFPPEQQNIPFWTKDCNPEKTLQVGEKVEFLIKMEKGEFLAHQIRNQALATLDNAMFEEQIMGGGWQSLYHSELESEFQQIVSGQKLDYGDFFDRRLAKMNATTLWQKIKYYWQYGWK